MRRSERELDREGEEGKVGEWKRKRGRQRDSEGQRDGEYTRDSPLKYELKTTCRRNSVQVQQPV
eukprot:3006015-Rhodomonas_salina.3